LDPSREDAYLQPQVRGTRSCLGTCVLRDRGGGHQQDGYRREALHQIRKNREGESPIIFGWRGPRLVWVKGAFFGDSIGSKALPPQRILGNAPPFADTCHLLVIATSCRGGVLNT